MSNEQLIHSQVLNFNGRDYEIQIFLRPNGMHLARTVVAPDDVIINDGASLEDVMKRHLSLLPLALDSRELNAGLLSS